MHIRKDDLVEVVTGDDKGTRGKVLRVLRSKNQVVVAGVNRVYKHLKPNRRNAQGGRLSREMPVSASNVLLYCSTCRRGVRVGKRYDEKDGRKELRAQAEQYERERDKAMARYHNYELGSAAYQIGIVLASAAVVTGMIALAYGAAGVAGFGLIFTGFGLFAPNLPHDLVHWVSHFFEVGSAH